MVPVAGKAACTQGQLPPEGICPCTASLRTLLWPSTGRTTWGSEVAVIRLTSQITTEPHAATIRAAVIPKTI